MHKEGGSMFGNLRVGRLGRLREGVVSLSTTPYTYSPKTKSVSYLITLTQHSCDLRNKISAIC
jgi:hypothetical protein